MKGSIAVTASVLAAILAASFPAYGERVPESFRPDTELLRANEVALARERAYFAALEATHSERQALEAAEEAEAKQAHPPAVPQYPPPPSVTSEDNTYGVERDLKWR